ncbi:MAG: aminotransferase class I/II-fold pyridoxal phosphate-dependent enzyme [Dehalococcoidales bacterium]|jgi:aminotransferase|nr:aminotransferase class I/II-fold pyridoxal phosphate-dependent enzyme [Dehalococcoidales bacterium]MDP6738248.1 aminotransferase class I/II-fold pyridoxal phosphate-dependent enzyme [Dehalococcoidales bacterium]
MSTNSNVQTEKSHTSQRANQLSPSGIRKFFDLLASTEGVISLGVGEPDYTTPWSIREAAIHSLEKGDTMYTSNSGMSELRQELSRYLKGSYQIDYDPSDGLLITVGVSEALDLALRAIIDPGDEVIMPDPCYVAYDACVILAGGIPVRVPTYEENNFELRAAAIEARVTDRTKAILFGYPANPTGTVIGRDKLSEIAEVVRRHRLLVISDEIYAKLVYGVEAICFAALPRMKDSTILLGGFSKAYAMTGWRIGYAAAPREIIAAMTRIHQYTIMCAPTMAQVAAVEALKSGESVTAEMVEDYNRRRLVIVKGLNDIGLTCFEPKGAFYAFPSIKSTGMVSEEFAETLLTEEKVAVVPGSAFGQCGEGYVRCCYATSLADIEEALSRLKRFIERHRKR